MREPAKQVEGLMWKVLRLADANESPEGLFIVGMGLEYGIESAARASEITRTVRPKRSIQGVCNVHDSLPIGCNVPAPPTLALAKTCAHRRADAGDASTASNSA